MNKWAFDTETVGTTPYQGSRLLGVSYASEDLSQQGYVPMSHLEGNNEWDVGIERSRSILSRKENTVYMWNMKYDMHFTHLAGIDIQATCLDVMLAFHLVDENEMSYELKALAKKYIGEEHVQDDAELRVLLKSRKLKKDQMDHLLPEEVEPYATNDSVLVWHMLNYITPKLKAQNLYQVWLDVCKFSLVTWYMEREGVIIDKPKAIKLRDEAILHKDALLNDLILATGKEDFNPNSVPQVRLFTGSHKTDKETLAEIGTKEALQIVQYRSHSKAIDTFYNGLIDKMGFDGRVHAGMKIHGTVTGRISCVQPNLMALPKDNPTHKARHVIKAPKGYKLLVFDWNQMELRFLAALTQDPFLVEVYSTGGDIHQATVDRFREVYNLVVKRDIAKRTNFGIVYGIGAPGLSQDTGLDFDSCVEILNIYHAMIPSIRQYQSRLERIARGQGYIQLWSGRRRHYNRFTDPHKAMSNYIQGGVAEMLRMAMCRIHDHIWGTDTKMLIQIHDELVFAVKPRTLKKVAKEIKFFLEDFNMKGVPLLADAKTGLNYGELTELEVK